MKMVEDSTAVGVVLTVIALTCCHSLPHERGQRKCFTSFDNFDECWEEIEELCLTEEGEFERCVEESEEEEIVLYKQSRHCYAS